MTHPIKHEKKSRDLWILSLILVVSFLLYLGSLPKEFTNWDDQEYITSNRLIRSFSFESLNKIITEPYFANYAPLTLLSYMLDYRLWKLNAAGYHFHNVALHLACVAVLFLLLRDLGLSRKVILLATCIFAIHPVNVETVSWASERKNLLAAFFFLLSFYFYAKYARVGSSRHYLTSLLTFILSILAKASTIVAPLAFLAYDYCRETKRIRDLRLFDKLPFIVAAEMLTFLSIHAAGLGSALNSYHQGGPLFSIISSGNLLEEYLKLLLWPVKLTALIYPPRFPALGDMRMWLSFAFLLLAAALLCKMSRQLFLWWSFFVIFLIPVLNVVPLPIMMANRYLYIPQIGIWIIFASVCIKLLETLDRLKMVRSVAAMILCSWVLFLGYQTFQTTKVWRNTYTLWTDTIEKNFFDGVAHYNLGLYFYRQKTINRAGHEYLISSLINPNYHNALSGLAGYFFEKGKADVAIKKFYAAVNAAPDSDLIVNNLGKALAENGDARRALYMFFRASYLNPKNIGALNNIVVLYLRVNEIGAAMEMARIMIERFPDSSDGYFRLGMCLESRGDLAGALEAWEESKRRLQPDSSLVGQIEIKIASARQKLSMKEPARIDPHGS